MNKYIFIDFSHLAFRSHYLLGQNVGIGKHRDVSNSICYGLINTISLLMNKFKADKPIILYDRPPYFRNQIYKDYKANRKPKEDEFTAAVSLSKQFIKDIRFTAIGVDGLEADDLAGIFSYLLAKKKKKIIIVTEDKDYYQLLRKNVKIYRPNKQEEYTKSKFKLEYNDLSPKDIILMKSIAGDAGDNIIGIQGVGPKTVEKLIQKYKTLKDIINNKKELEKDRMFKKIFKEKDWKDRIKLNQRLVKIPNSKKDIHGLIERGYITKKQIKESLDKIEVMNLISKHRLSDIFRRYGLKRFRNWLIQDKKDYSKLLGIKVMKRKVLSIKEMKNMDFPYPPEPDL